MEHYVYVYLDPRKPGNYNYINYNFEYEPFYIGKGKERRYKTHLEKVKNGICKDLLKDYIIKELLSLNLEPIIIKYRDNMKENEALELEKNMIISIGRVDLKTGPLSNLSNGGQGISNRKFTDTHRKNLSLARKGKVSEKQLEHLKNIHKKMIGNKRTLGISFSKEVRERMGKSHYKPVYQLNSIGEILNEFDSIKNAENYIGVPIKKVLSGKGKTAGGFYWKYKNEK
jgi:hypothetical protein